MRVCEQASERESLCVCLCACTPLCIHNVCKGKDAYILYIHVHNDLCTCIQICYVVQRQRISAGKALHFVLADDALFLSIFPNPFEGTTWFLHVAVRDEKLTAPLSCWLAS